MTAVRSVGGILRGLPKATSKIEETLAVQIDAIPEPTEEAAATWLRETCGVTSRAELDHNDTAASTFHAFVRRPWQEHCAK